MSKIIRLNNNQKVKEVFRNGQRQIEDVNYRITKEGIDFGNLCDENNENDITLILEQNQII